MRLNKEKKMIRFILSFSIVFIAFQSLADFSEEGLGDYTENQLSKLQEWRIEEGFVLVEQENNSFCILSHSGGGDSGGGIIRNLEMPLNPPEDDEDEDGFDSWEDKNKSHRDRDFFDVTLQTLQEDMLHSDTTFDVLELLSCQNGQGIPFEVRSSLRFLLLEMRTHAFRQGRRDDVRFLSDVINLLVDSEEI